ncbi:hypothetical protein [Spirochaeta africana]|uniref:DUF4398 domain-containing protein n=1 Tax=Spirochaeta africana (strain ATCC 700263 / DSM 8902 / Z-7692) TaxID=889378 RepID=H9UGF3_SPIAZ|nr:hypothetical protein [Spirochaeta africana]AFG36596.1 hypothetical protein Spiaf_0493 [Spirochaeta africana DSM 8902]
MKFWRISIVMLTLVALVFAGCATTPEEPDPVTDAPEEVRAQDPVPDDEVARPETERNTALDLRTRISERGVADQDPQNMSAADQAFDQAGDQLDVDNQAARDLYLEAISGYRAVLRTAFGSQNAELRESIQSVRSEADEVRAQRAAADRYASGVTAWDTAEEYTAAEDYDYAHDAYQDANRYFTDARDHARERRQAALDALERSRADIEETEQRIRDREQQVASETEDDEELAEAERRLAEEIEEDE